MEEFNTERKSSELNKEEVNVYTDDCGVTRYNCVTDCFWVFSAFPSRSSPATAHTCSLCGDRGRPAQTPASHAAARCYRLAR